MGRPGRLPRGFTLTGYTIELTGVCPVHARGRDRGSPLEMTGRLPSHRHKSEQNADHNTPSRLLRVKNGDIRPR
jgi:hypothetical protein